MAQAESFLVNLPLLLRRKTNFTHTLQQQVLGWALEHLQVFAGTPPADVTAYRERLAHVLFRQDETYMSDAALRRKVFFQTVANGDLRNREKFEHYCTGKSCCPEGLVSLKERLRSTLGIRCLLNPPPALFSRRSWEGQEEVASHILQIEATHGLLSRFVGGHADIDMNTFLTRKDLVPQLYAVTKLLACTASLKEAIRARSGRDWEASQAVKEILPSNTAQHEDRQHNIIQAASCKDLHQCCNQLSEILCDLDDPVLSGATDLRVQLYRACSKTLGSLHQLGIHEQSIYPWPLHLEGEKSRCFKKDRKIVECILKHISHIYIYIYIIGHWSFVVDVLALRYDILTSGMVAAESVLDDYQSSPELLDAISKSFVDLYPTSSQLVSAQALAELLCIARIGKESTNSIERAHSSSKRKARMQSDAGKAMRITEMSAIRVIRKLVEGPFLAQSALGVAKQNKCHQTDSSLKKSRAGGHPRKARGRSGLGKKTKERRRLSRMHVWMAGNVFGRKANSDDFARYKQQMADPEIRQQYEAAKQFVGMGKRRKRQRVQVLGWQLRLARKAAKRQVSEWKPQEALADIKRHRLAIGHHHFALLQKRRKARQKAKKAEQQQIAAQRQSSATSCNLDFLSANVRQRICTWEVSPPSAL